MENSFRDRSVLDLIRILSSQAESGRLQVTSGMTEGAVFVDRGQLIDASFGKLTGFQAINALASIPDASFNFDPSIAPPTRSSITPNERILLQDFFGIGGVHAERADLPFTDKKDDDPPAQVIPLSDVDEPENLEMLEPFVSEDPSSSLTSFTESPDTQHAAEAVVPNDDEVTLVRSKIARAENRPAIEYEAISRSKFRPVLFVTILTILFAAAGVLGGVYRLRQRNSTTPATVQTSSPDNAPQVSSKTETTTAAADKPQVSIRTETTPAAVQTSTPADAPRASNSIESTSAVSDLTGKWKVVNTVEQTSYQAYKNMEVGFELAINQTGNEFTGMGQKISENGRTLSAPSRTPIWVQGSIDGDKVEATFSESGAKRKTSGRFVWRIDTATGRLTGTFASAAARSSGRSAATKRLGN